MKKLIYVIIALAVLTGGYFIWKSKEKAIEKKDKFEFTNVKKGNIVNTVSCTGTLGAKGTVEVGTQISGTVEKVLVDYNQKVREGQILAIIDTTQAGLSVQSSKADIEKAEAQMKLTKLDYESKKTLYETKYISEYEYLQALATYKNAVATYINAKNTHQRNINNLELYSIIRSPINGTVISRNVEPGQTVAASFSTPTLFLLARDLNIMEIQAYVDESDIGNIKVGMNAQFSVTAYPDDTFQGIVTQIRLEPVTTSNVVNYVVMIDAENIGNKLLPGMTADIDFTIDDKKDIFMITNSALKFKPLAEEMQAVFARKKAEWEKKNGNTDGQHAESTGSYKRGEGRIGREQNDGENKRQNKHALLWYLNEKQELDMQRVETGITDGSNTEISGKNITENMQIIIKESEDESNNNQGLFGMPRPGRH